MPFVFTPATYSTLDSWFDLQVALKLDDLEESKEQSKKVKLALVASTDGLSNDKLNKWITVGYKSNIKVDKEN